AAREHGRDYLKGRGISPDTIEHAEKAGMVRYADGGVLDGVRADAPALEVVAAMLAGCKPLRR
ncbi:hypothetical protein, partial [Aeromonas caviae]|uniref:hypothetical protein n=1 Tax=Aeromonas caviae TaxID=648 RepID=UPI001CC5C9EC